MLSVISLPVHVHHGLSVLREVVEEEIKDLPAQEQETVKEEIEITKPVETPKPSAIEKTAQQVAAKQQSIWITIGRSVSGFFHGIGRGVQFALNAVGNGVGWTGRQIAGGFTFLADRLPGMAGQFTANIGRSIAWISDGFRNQVSNASETIGYAFVNLGYMFVTEPTQIYNVEVVVLSPTSAKVTWKTNKPANGKINYGLDTTYDFDMQTDKRTTNHEFILTNLQPDTEYHFEVMSHDKTYVYDANRSFKTPAAE